MKLLHVIGSADPASGGPVEGLFRQAQATRDMAVREVVTLDAPDQPFLAGVPMTIHALGAPRRRGPLGRLVSHYGYSRRLVPWLKARVGNYDAVIIHGLWNFAASGAALALRQVKTPYFVFPHGMMAPYFRRRHPFKNLAKRVSWRLFEGPLLAGAKAVLFTTEEERQTAGGQFPGHAYQGRVAGYGTTPPPLPKQAFTNAFSKRAPGLNGRRYLLYLSRIHSKKGCDLLIEAFAALAYRAPHLDLVIAGPDQSGWTDRLRKRSKALGMGDRVHWTGMLQGDAKWGAFHGAEAFILPSHHESFGIVVAEALGCGVPVLITNQVNIWREVEAGGAGLVADDTLDGIRSLLTRWFDVAPSQRKAMSEAASVVFDRHFNIERTAPQLLADVRRLIA